MTTAVRLDSVRFAWPGARPLFEDLSFEAAAGGITALVGASGCGKSTVLRLAAGLLQPDAGTVRTPAGERAFVFQSPTLLPWRTVAANVGLPLELKGERGPEAAARVRDALSRVGLADSAELLPRQLSGGMRMRASIARALVTSPSLLLMDEPFSALDPITRKRMQQEFLALWQAARFTVLLVSHDIDEAVLMADRVLVFKADPGRIVADIVVDLPRPRPPALLHDPALGQIAARAEAAL